MAVLIALALACAPVVPPARGPVDRVGRWHDFIHEAAGRAAIPETWIARVIRAESAGRTMLGGRPITSPAGAMGLMQLMPATWGAMRARLGLGRDPFDPHDNILAGAFFLRLMYDRFGYPGLFGAYNAGPARYAAHLRGRALPAETVAYLAEVTGGAVRQPSPSRAAAAVAPAPPALFVTTGGRATVAARDGLAAITLQQLEPRSRLLFVVRHVAPAEPEPSPAPEGGE